MVPKRAKKLHSVGYVAKIKMISLSNKYTGAFREDSIGLIRTGFLSEPAVDIMILRINIPHLMF